MRTRPVRTQEHAALIKMFAHLAATLSSWAAASVVSMQVQRQCVGNMDILGLLLVSTQLAGMILPYVRYHKDGGPVLLPPISCANNYSWFRRLATWFAFTLLAGGMHAWTVLTLPGNPMQSNAVVAKAFAYSPSACLVLLAGNPVPLRDYTTAVVARGTDVEWLVPASFSHSVKQIAPRNRVVIRWLMALHLLGALALMTVPLVGALLRKQWHTKLCACFALALFIPGCHRRLPIFHLAGELLDCKVMETYRDEGSRRAGGGAARRLGWTNEINVPRGGRELWRAVNWIGALEHVLLNALMLVTLSTQHYDEIRGPIGWASRAICLGWNVGFASFGGRWWLSRLMAAATKYSSAGRTGVNAASTNTIKFKTHETLAPRRRSRSPSRRVDAQ